MNPTSFFKIIIAIMIVVLTAISAFVLLTFIVQPKQQLLFDQKVMSVGANNSQNLSRYVMDVEQSLQRFSKRVPLSIFENHLSLEEERFALDEWVSMELPNAEKNIENLQSMILYSYDELNKQRETPLYKVDSPEINFLLIDMANRIRNGESTYLEVVKLANVNDWQLHRMIPLILNDQISGYLHVTLSSAGIKELFSSHQANPYVGEIQLIQLIDGFQQLPFLIMGSGSDQFPQNFYTIPSSYWQLWYRPSTKLYDEFHQLPLWYFIAIAIVFFVLSSIVALIFWVRGKPQKISSKNTKSQSLSTKEESRSESLKTEELSDTRQTIDAIKDTEEKPDVSTLQEEPADTISIPENIFRAYDIRGIAYKELTPELAYAIGCAVATEVLNAGDNAIILGRDARTHSAEFASCMSKGIISTGCDVIDVGLVPTPLLNFTTHEHPATSSGVIVTASHNGKEYNGCKIIVKGNTLVDGDIQRIKQRILDNDVVLATDKGKEVQDDLSQAYIDRIISDIVVMPGTKIVVDAANGATSELAPRLLNALGCNITPLFCSFDGEFPNHDPDPSIPENLSTLQEHVVNQTADIGFAFDGDGDRLVVVTQKGNIVWPDQLLMLFAQDIVARHPACDVVFDIKSTCLLPRLISDNGGRPIMWKTGHSHIKAKMKETNALLGGEFSGHIFFKERWFGFDDGLYAAVRLLELMALTGQTSDELLASLPVMVATPEIRITVPEVEKFLLVEKVVSLFDLDDERIIGHTTIDGFRVDFVDGWGLIRSSNTSPSLTLRFEAENDDALNNIKTYFKEQFSKVDKRLVFDA